MNSFKCPGCGAGTSGRQNFCSECGHPLEKTCSDCGFKVRHMYSDKYKFCPECGGKMVFKKNK